MTNGRHSGAAWWLAGLGLFSACAAENPGSAGASAEDHEVLSGTVQVIHGDPVRGSDDQGVTLHYLVDDQARAHRLDLGDVDLAETGGIAGLTQRHVRLSGDLVGNVFHVESIADTGQARLFAPPPVSGAQPWVTLLCRYAGNPAEPEAPAYFVELMNNVFGGMDHYWRQVSYNSINVPGTQVRGWYQLPSTQSQYINDEDGMPLFGDLANDCMAAADADVDFRNFVGVNLMFNAGVGFAGGWGGQITLTRDGQTKSFRTTWMPPSGYRDQSVLGQEMGHGFGLKHSGGPGSNPYDSSWDVMSQGGICNVTGPGGCLGVHTIAFNKDVLGWIPASRKLTKTTFGTTRITLDRLGQPASSTSLLMAQIPIGGSTTRFYTVEARRRGATGNYDQNIPADAVIIHKVDKSLADKIAQVVDIDNNGNPNDGSAQWLTGETFTDAANGVTVTVVSQTTSGFVVDVTLQSRRLTVQNTPGGIVTRNPGIFCGGDCIEDFQTGQSVTLGVIPAEGKAVDTWSGCNSSTPTTCTVNMSANKTVGVTWTCDETFCMNTCQDACLEAGKPPLFCFNMCSDQCSECK